MDKRFERRGFERARRHCEHHRSAPMTNFLELFLGILTAMGGFVEVGELTFAVNAGAKFGYSLLWIAALGTVGIVVYGEMAGRVAAVRAQPVFSLIRERVGFDAGLVTLSAATA